ncbi:hypothetical protein D3C80_1483170 [compost metagenome]
MNHRGSESQHLLRSQRPLGQFHQRANFYAIGQRQLADATGIGTGFTQFDRHLLRRQNLQHLLQMIAFTRLLPGYARHNRIGHQKQFQLQLGLLFFQGDRQT